VEFREQGWNVKRLIKQLVMTRAYRQTSQVTAELRERDPQNIWLARQSRYRLEAEFVRDNALAVSNLLVRKLGGPSVKPYQPAGYWSYLNFPTREWQNDAGESLYRRGLYTHWQRTFLHPSMAAFDAPSREECTVDRARSNTPLQALVLLNDPTYVESARALATHAMQAGAENAVRFRYLFRQVLQREPRTEELAMLGKLLEKHQTEFQVAGEATKPFLAVGALKPPAELPAAELAAWTSICRVVLNLHETITRN